MINWKSERVPIILRKIRYVITGTCEHYLFLFKRRWYSSSSIPMGVCCVCGHVFQIGPPHIEEKPLHEWEQEHLILYGHEKYFSTLKDGDWWDREWHTSL
jgi:hypothetical protein